MVGYCQRLFELQVLKYLETKEAMRINIKHNHLFLKIALSGLVLAGGTVGLVGTSQAELAAPSASRPALTVRTTTLREDKWARTLAANGSIMPWQEAIISAQVQGLRIAEVKVSIGDHVQQGEVLVTLDNFARDNLTRSGNESGSSLPAQGRIVSVVDPEMRHGRKSASSRFDGYKIHAAATSDGRLITGVGVSPGADHDGVGTTA